MAGKIDIDGLKQLAQLVTDPLFVVDAERRILHANETFEALFPDPVAESLRGSRCFDVLKLEVCKDQCLALRAIRQGGRVEQQPVHGCVVANGAELVLHASAVPVDYLEGVPVGAMVVYRDAKADTKAQRALRDQLDDELVVRQELEEQLRRQTLDLLDANDELNRLELEQAGFRKGTDEPSSPSS